MNQILILSSVMLWTLVLVNLLLTFGLIRRLRAGTQNLVPVERGLAPGEVAPPFTAQTLDGKTVTLTSYIGQPTAFLFITTTCGPCRDGVPRYEALYQKAAQSGVQLVLVSFDKLLQTQTFVDEFNIRMPVVVAPHDTNSFMEDYKVPGTPTYCLIDQAGNVVHAGFPDFNGGPWKDLVEVWRLH